MCTQIWEKIDFFQADSLKIEHFTLTTAVIFDIFGKSKFRDLRGNSHKANQKNQTARQGGQAWSVTTS